MLISRKAVWRALLAALNALILQSALAQGIPSAPLDKRVGACLACHASQDQLTRDGYFPRIAGKPAGYLYNQLLNFRDGRRQSPAMTWMVSQLSDEYLREIADYFSLLKAPYPPPVQASVPAATMERGRMLARQGDASRKLPACAACHGQALTGVAPAIPSLLGLPRDYLNAQFGAWKNGARHAGKPDCMATIAERLTNDDVLAVTAWLSSQPMPPQSQPQAAGKEALPLSCGSVPGGGK
jgi:cytochrome c553